MVNWNPVVIQIMGPSRVEGNVENGILTQYLHVSRTELSTYKLGCVIHSVAGYIKTD